MKSLFLTALLSFLIVVGKVKGQEPECSEKEAFTTNKWQTSGDASYDDDLEAFVLKNGNLGIPRLYKEAGDFKPEDPKNSAHLYIQYETQIYGSVDDVEFIVYPNKGIEQESLDLGGNFGDSTVQIVELSTDAIGDINVRIEAKNLGGSDEIRVSRIGILYGGVGTPEEIQLAIETECDWKPPVTTTPASTPYESPPLKKVECIDTLEEYGTATAWTFPAGLQNISKAESISSIPKPPEGGLDIFYLEGDGSRKTFSRSLTRGDLADDESFFIYIKHHSYIPVQGDEKVTVNNVDNGDYFEVLTPIPDAKGWGHSILKLIDDAGPFDVSILVDGYKTTDFFLIDKIAIVSGKDERTEEEMIEEIERVCTPDPATPTTTSTSTTKESTESSPSTEPPTSEVVDPRNSTTSAPGNETTATPSPPIQPIVEELRTEDDFKQQQWAILPQAKYNYRASFDKLPTAITSNTKLTGDGIFYFEGDNTRSQIKIEKNLSYVDFSRPTFMYIKYYTLYQSSGEPRSILVTPTEFESSLSSTRENTWGEELVELSPSKEDTKLQITINGFRANEFFLLDEIYLVHGKEFDDIEEIKEFVNKGDAKDDDGFGTTELVLVTVLPALAVALICTGLYFFLRRR